MAKQIPDDLPKGERGERVPNPGAETPRSNKYRNALIGVAVVLLVALAISQI